MLYFTYQSTNTAWVRERESTKHLKQGRSTKRAIINSHCNNLKGWNQYNRCYFFYIFSLQVYWNILFNVVVKRIPMVCCRPLTSKQESQVLQPRGTRPDAGPTLLAICQLLSEHSREPNGHRETVFVIRRGVANANKPRCRARCTSSTARSVLMAQSHRNRHRT